MQACLGSAGPGQTHIPSALRGLPRGSVGPSGAFQKGGNQRSFGGDPGTRSGLGAFSLHVGSGQGVTG